MDVYRSDFVLLYSFGKIGNISFPFKCYYFKYNPLIFDAIACANQRNSRMIGHYDLFVAALRYVGVAPDNKCEIDYETYRFKLINELPKVVASTGNSNKNRIPFCYLILPDADKILFATSHTAIIPDRAQQILRHVIKIDNNLIQFISFQDYAMRQCYLSLIDYCASESRVDFSFLRSFT